MFGRNVWRTLYSRTRPIPRRYASKGSNDVLQADGTSCKPIPPKRNIPKTILYTSGGLLALSGIIDYLIRPVVTAVGTSCDKMGRKFFVGGNWKMNGTKEEIQAITAHLCRSEVDPDVEVVVAPPTCFLEYTRHLLPKEMSLAAQNCFMMAKGAFTGEVAPAMVKECGACWVIIGHSERRQIFGENEKLLVNKLRNAQCEGLGVIYCIGETLEERECDKTEEILFSQMACMIGGVADYNQLVIAYEPVWAIGTGKTATPEQAQEIHQKLRNYIKDNVNESIADKIRIIYGGSVTAATSKCLASMEDIDGFLVGGASLKPEFVEIINSNAAAITAAKK